MMIEMKSRTWRVASLEAATEFDLDVFLKTKKRGWPPFSSGFVKQKFSQRLQQRRHLRGSSDPGGPSFVEQRQVVDVGGLADDEVNLLRHWRLLQRI